MLVNEVFDVFKEYPDNPADHIIWVGLISADNRAGYICIDGEEYPKYENALSTSEPKAVVKDLLESDAAIVKEFHDRPRIENSSFAMQKTLEAAKEMESMMLFVGEDDCPVWKNHALSKAEYERQMDADIDKFGLQCIAKHEDGCLYVCYQDFLCSFTEKGRELDREAEPVQKEVADTAKQNSGSVKALIATDEATLEKIKEQFGVEVEYTDKNAFLIEPFYHSRIMDEIEYHANSWCDASQYGSAVLNDNGRKKELFDEICFRLDRAACADDDGLNWAQAREIIESCFQHEKERFDRPKPHTVTR